MRFRCEQCSTEYSLPDEAVARATRARCPRCKHSQLLHAGGVPLTTPPGGKSQIGRVALTTRSVEPTPPPEEEEELFGELDWETDTQLDFVVGRSNVQYDDIPAAPAPALPPVSPPPGSGPPAPLLAPSSVPIDFSDLEVDPPSPETNTLADEWPETERSDPWRRTPLPPVQAPGAATGRAPPPAAPPAQPRRPPTRAPEPPRSPPAPPASKAPAPTPAAVPAEPCAACGGKLVDADDLASGVCGACRARTAAALGRGTARTPPRSQTPALSPAAPRTPPRSQTPALTPGVPTVTDPAEVSSRLPTPPARPRHAFRSMPPPDRRGPLWALLGILGLVAVVSGTLWYLRIRPDPRDLKAVADALPRPGKKHSPAGARLPEGLEARISSWKAPADARPVPDLLIAAQADLAKDTEASALAAERGLETALVQAPSNVDALGLWMESIARGRGSQLSRSELESLLRLGDSALERMGAKPPLQVGLASLLLVRGGPPDIERARSLGQSAVDATRPPPPPAPGTTPPAPAPAPTAEAFPWGTRARLVLAEAYATSSAALALSLLQEVQDRDPTQRRVFNVRATAHEAGGSPRAATTDLQARLAVDPDEPRTARALARLWGQVGETAQARKIYERLQANPATQDGAAIIEMATLRAGAERAPAEAVKLLTHALPRGKLTGADLLRAQVTLARVARAAGEPQTAAQAVTAALKISPDDVQAHLQGLLVDL
ncbi:MAG TPA: zinc-ribbon domain-containing protein, partial [Myxococcaceae bacterium]|nr:zinc-ribbon domain-containing protein [Myxococcaceae bacterium]